MSNNRIYWSVKVFQIEFREKIRLREKQDSRSLFHTGHIRSQAISSFGVGGFWCRHESEFDLHRVLDSCERVWILLE